MKGKINMFKDISKLPHQEKLFLAYYGTSTPDNIVGNFYKSRQKLTALLQSKETEKLFQQIMKEQIPQILQKEIHDFFNQ